MDTTMEKRMRKRMTMIKSEKSRAYNSQFSTISSMKSFDEIKDEREATLEHDHESSDDERDDTCNSSVMSDCISEMRRRRIHEMTYHRPYPIKSTKKKHNFWKIEEELPRPAVFLSPSFLETDKRLSVPKSSSSSNKNQQELPNSSNKAVSRVLWKIETSNLESNAEAVVLDNSDERENMKESFSQDEIIDGIGYEDDEIMTPVRFKKFIGVYDTVKSDGMEHEGPGQIRLMIPTSHQATVTEISTATQALSAFVTSAVAVMKEAKTPERNYSREYKGNLQKFEPVFPQSRFAHEETVHDKVCHGTATALKLFKDTALAMTGTPSNKLITKVPTPMTTQTANSSMDETEIMVMKLGLGDDNDVDEVVEKVDIGALWPSLFFDIDTGFESIIAEPIDPDNKAILEALVQGGALQREINGKNMLKLFVDMYQKDTFEKIVSAVKELKGLQGLVVCRALDKNRSTYRSSQEITSLFDATRGINQLDSLALLNFDSSSMTNLAMMIHDQPLLFRIQIQLIDGTLNGELLGVMATAPRLTHVSFDLKESCSLGTLMNSKTLESVCVNSRDLQLKKSHIRTLIYSLQTNFTLTTLDLGPAISVEHFRSLCIALRQNFRLESLRVNLELNTEEESNIAALELANLLRVNSFLLNVWNYSYQTCGISDTNKRDIFAALRNSNSMQEFKFFSEDIGDWKNTNTGNPSWLKRHLGTPGTAASTCGEATEDFDQSTSFYSKASTLDHESIREVLEDESLREDLLTPFCGVDCSTFSPPFDCSSVKQMSANFQNWATTTSKQVRRMEV